MLVSKLPPLQWFRSFDAAARYLNFTSAGRSLGISQPAVSQNIQNLEHSLGKTLFVRKARNVELTEHGRKLLPFVNGAMTQLVEGALNIAANKREGVLRVACTTSFASCWLIPRLEKFQHLYPDIEIELVSTLWLDDYAQAETDISIRYGSGEMLSSNATILKQDNIIAVCSPGFAKKYKVSQSVENSFILTPLIRTIGTSDTWHHWFASANIHAVPEFSLTVDIHAAAVEMARQGLGLALISSIIVSKSIKDGELVSPLRHSMRARENYYIQAKSGNSHSDVLARRFIDWINSQVERQFVLHNKK